MSTCLSVPGSCVMSHFTTINDSRTTSNEFQSMAIFFVPTRSTNGCKRLPNASVMRKHVDPLTSLSWLSLFQNVCISRFLCGHYRYTAS